VQSDVRDIDAVRNAIAEPWSSSQAEGQINRLKSLKRAMFGRAGIEAGANTANPINSPPQKVTKTPISCNVTMWSPIDDGGIITAAT
jgi:hypothetical protein